MKIKQTWLPDPMMVLLISLSSAALGVACECPLQRSEIEDIGVPEQFCAPAEPDPDYPGPPSQEQLRIKAALAGSCRLFEDFSECVPLQQRSDHWQGATAWWQPPGTEAPRLIGEYLVLRARSGGIRSELQADAEAFRGGRLIVGAWSDRWAIDRGWTDTSFGWELWGPGIVHDGILFIDGHLGVFHDVTGQCDGESSCRYQEVAGWPEVASAGPLIFAFDWNAAAGTVKLSVLQDQVIAEEADAHAVTAALHVRLNANLADSTDPVDHEQLWIDFVCVQ